MNFEIVCPHCQTEYKVDKLSKKTVMCSSCSGCYLEGINQKNTLDWVKMACLNCKGS